MSTMLPWLKLLVLTLTLLSSITSAQNQGVIVLTTRNFDISVRDGSIWLIEFYAPWCSHCKTFAPSYEELASSLHADNKPGKKKIKVAKIDGDSERAIVSRFNIAGFPSFFLIDGWSVYEYDDGRNVENMMLFAKDGYLQKEALPFYSSPMGPLGQLQSLLLMIAIQMLKIFEWMQVFFGISPMVAGILFIGGVIFTGLTCMIVLAFSMVPKEKTE